MIDIAEQICEAVDKIVTERMKGIKYDTTVTATIIDDSHANQYYYTVSTGEAQFVAFAAENTYKKDDSVLVTIPNNDYDQQKIIIGKNINKEDKEPYRYIKPFNTLVNVSGNIINNINKASLLANGAEEEVSVWTWDVTNSDLSLDGYTRIGLQGQFSSWLEEFNTIIGDYGYKLVITSERDEVIGDSSSKEIQTENEGSGEADTPSSQAEGDAMVETIFYLSSVTDMIGNPYRFSAYHEQEKVFDISDLGKILKIELYFYQKPNSFFDANGNLVSNEDTFEKPLPNNLFTKDAYICFGYDVNEFENEAAFLYSINSSTYNRTCTVEANKKVINLRWIHRYEDGSLGVVTDLPTDYIIKWYRYRLGAPSADQYSGVYWDDVTPKDTNSNIINSFSLTLNPDTNRDMEQVKAIVYDATKKPVVRSNIISFKNEDETVNNTTVQVLSGLTITCDDKMNGNYFMYGQNNQLFDESQQYRERILTVQFKDENTGVTEATSITWTVPETNTMVKKLSESNDKTSLSFTIKPTYNATATNNVITCTVVKDALTYVATFTPRFGLMGTNGTDATLVIDFDYPVLGVLDGQDVIATLRLYDSQHNEIDLAQDTYSGKITWGLEGYTDKLAWGSPTNVKMISDEMAQNQCKLSFEGSSIPYYHSAIVVATLTGFGDYALTVKKALPLTTNRNKYVAASIPTSVIYSSTGYADYFKEPIFMVYNTGNMHRGEKITHWKTWYPPVKENEMNYAGTISKNNILQPLKFYVKGADNYNILGYDKENGTLLWAQPLVIMQNEYPSTTVNQWNGKNIELNENEGVILTPALAAGKKNSNDNTFSGVMMGDWSQTNTANDLTKQTGIYGFHHGAVSFAFKEDGTAFIGKSGSGRIHFDGTNSTIKSETWEKNKSGLFMDLDNGVIKLQSSGQQYLAQMIRKEDFDNRGNIVYYEKKAQYDDIGRNQPYNNQLAYYYKEKNTENEYEEYIVDSIPENWNKDETYVSLSKEAFEQYTGDIYIKNNQSTEPLYNKVEGDKPEWVMGRYYKLLEADPNQYATQRFIYEKVDEFKPHNGNGTSVYFTLEEIDQKYITISSEEKQYPIAIGMASTPSLRNFKVDWNGTCYIADGIFQGTISADGGRIGAWIIDGTKLLGLGGKLMLDAEEGIKLIEYLHGITLESSTIKLPYLTEQSYGTFGIGDGNGVPDEGPTIENYYEGSLRTRFIAGYNHIGMAYVGGGYISINDKGIDLNIVDNSNSSVTGTVNVGCDLTANGSITANSDIIANKRLTSNDCITTKGWIAVGYDEEDEIAKIILNREDGLIETSGNIKLNGTINGATISTNTIVTSGGTDLRYAYFG